MEDNGHSQKDVTRHDIYLLIFTFLVLKKMVDLLSCGGSLDLLSIQHLLLQLIYCLKNIADNNKNYISSTAAIVPQPPDQGGLKSFYST